MKGLGFLFQNKQVVLPLATKHLQEIAKRTNLVTSYLHYGTH